MFCVWVSILFPKPNEIPGTYVRLNHVEGRTWPITQFAIDHLFLLLPHERLLVKKWLSGLGEIDRLPKCLRDPLAVDKAERKSGIQAKMCGRRSVYLPSECVQLKGCISRPIKNPFPASSLNLQMGKLIKKGVPYGALGAEQVMREILAWCFQKNYCIEIGVKPIAIYEYQNGLSKGSRFCLLLEIVSDTRIEALWDYAYPTLSKVVAAYLVERTKFFGSILHGEVGLLEPYPTDYVRMKRNLSLKFNQNMGFRGVLNSNNGNELLWHDSKGWHLAFCDFDSFRVFYEAEPHLSDERINDFTTLCCAEFLAGNPLINTFLLVEEQVSRKEAKCIFDGIYSDQSHTWNAYKRSFIELCGSKFEKDAKFENAVCKFQSLPIYLDLIMEKIPNSLNLPSWQNSIYVPHGPPRYRKILRRQPPAQLIEKVAELLVSPMLFKRWEQDHLSYENRLALSDTEKYAFKRIDRQLMRRFAIRCEKHLCELGTIRSPFPFGA